MDISNDVQTFHEQRTLGRNIENSAAKKLINGLRERLVGKRIRVTRGNGSSFEGKVKFLCMAMHNHVIQFGMEGKSFCHEVNLHPKDFVWDVTIEEL